MALAASATLLDGEEPVQPLAVAGGRRGCWLGHGGVVWLVDELSPGQVGLSQDYTLARGRRTETVTPIGTVLAGTS